MPTQQQISNKIIRGQLLQADLTKTAVTDEKGCCIPECWPKIVNISELVQALQTQYLIPDYISDDTVYIYKKLSKIIGLQYIDGSAFDPNAQHNNTIILDAGGARFNNGTYSFTSLTNPSLSDFHNVYFPLFGNSPQFQIWLDSGDGVNFNLDVSTSPIVFRNSNGIVSVVWSYPIAVTGYITAIGIGTVFVGQTTGGISTNSNERFVQLTATGNATTLTYTLPHGQTGVSSSDVVLVTAQSPDAVGIFSYILDAINVTIVYQDGARDNGTVLTFNVLIQIQ